MKRSSIRRLCELETPFYFYDEGLIRKNINTLLKNFSGCNARIFFAAKANTSIYILKLIRTLNVGAEVVSPGEIYMSLKAGFRAQRILYNNIARTENEVLYAMKNGVVFFNFEAIDQALLLEKCAGRLGKRIKAFVRINPGIFSETHPHLLTGSASSKFGVGVNDLKSILKSVRKFRSIKLVGVHSHIGSQILSPLPFVKAVRKVIDVITFFREEGIRIMYVNLGGGFGIPYHPREKKLNFAPIKKVYAKLARKYRVEIFLEPGRFIVGNAGFIVTKVISVKRRRGMPLYVIDAGMTENPRPALYQAYHHIESIFKVRGQRRRSRVVGPLCENTDEFGVYNLPELKIGDLLMIYNCGAYTRTMASNYNGRLLPPELIFKRGRFGIIRNKQKYRSLINNEKY
jgi:diaminopimelate decarboxylase